ncbi:hypothetical protein ACH0BU_17095 [Sphingomonas olei]
MADNAIEKLFEEIRQAKAAVIAAEEEIKELEVARRKAREKESEARARVALLNDTLHKHIHEGLPIVQAKMIAQAMSQFDLRDFSPEYSIRRRSMTISSEEGLD